MARAMAELTEPEQQQRATHPASTMSCFDHHDHDHDHTDPYQIPSVAELAKIADIPVFDREGKEHTFRSLCFGGGVTGGQKSGGSVSSSSSNGSDGGGEGDESAGSEKTTRRMVIFIRHFFCGMCQEFIRTLSHALPPSTLSALTPSVHISIIGCGQSELIPMYAAATNCAFDLYADPSRRLYEGLGLTSTLTLGARPAYLHSSMATNMWRSVVQGLKAGTAMARGGSLTQVGGEFLFDGRGECVWAHRMHSTRDHAEVPELRRVLGMPVAAEDGTGAAAAGAAAAGAAQEEKSVTVGVPKVVMEEHSAMVSAGSGAGIA